MTCPFPAALPSQIPALWDGSGSNPLGYPSMKSLASWVTDLERRCAFIDQWIKGGIPAVFWISGFFFPQVCRLCRPRATPRISTGLSHWSKMYRQGAQPKSHRLTITFTIFAPSPSPLQAFLTGTLQNYARKYKKPIDTISFGCSVMEITPDQVTTKPADGCYIHGLFAEGARWDPETHALGESRPKELYTTVPVIHLIPVQNRVSPETVRVVGGALAATITPHSGVR